MLDVAYRTVDSPVGTLLLAATTVGLVRVAFDIEDHDTVLARLGGAGQPAHPATLPPGWTPSHVSSTSTSPSAARCSRCRSTCDSPTASGAASIEHLRDIGYGRRESYATVAAAVGHPRAVRAVGTACAHNPLPVVIPCHRVVRSDGSPGQYVGGPQAKVALLSLEAA